MNKDLEPHSTGMVYLVGAGPGDPGLITVRGVECLQQADAVLYDCLANPRLLVHTSGDVEYICLGKDGHKRIWSLDEIIQKMIELARAGKTVVRLKGGDPAVFSRGAEEVEHLRQAQIPFEIVPGVTSALAAASYAEIPITHRAYSSAIGLVVGQENGTQSKSNGTLDYAQLAKFPGTLMFYMGITSSAHWTGGLIAGGMSPETPVTIVRRATFADQQTLRCTLGQVEQTLQHHSVRPPAIMIVGKVNSFAPQRGWFERRPLFGQRILVTRPVHQAAALGELFERQGADVRFQPAIEIKPPADWSEVDQVIANLGQFDWLVFSSANGVQMFLDRIWETGHDMRVLGPLAIAAIGPATTASLADYRLTVDCQPTRFQAEDLAAILAPGAEGKRFLLIRASRGREVLAAQLTAAGGEVQQVVAYASTDVTEPDEDIVRDLQEKRIDWITVTSSAIARALDRMFGSELAKARLVSISPVTTQTLRELGHEPAAEAAQATMTSLVAAVQEYFTGAESG